MDDLEKNSLSQSHRGLHENCTEKVRKKNVFRVISQFVHNVGLDKNGKTNKNN